MKNPRKFINPNFQDSKKPKRVANNRRNLHIIKTKKKKIIIIIIKRSHLNEEKGNMRKKPLNFLQKNDELPLLTSIYVDQKLIKNNNQTDHSFDMLQKQQD